MSSRLTQLLLALSLLLNCFVLAGFVYRSWIAPPHWQGRSGAPPPPPPPGRWISPIDALSQDLKLDETQKQALKPVFDQYGKSRHERVKEIVRIGEQMSAELQKPAFDAARIDGLVDQMAQLRAEQQKENLRTIAQMAGALRPEQREELHKILGERYGGPWRGSRGPRPPE